MYLGRLAYSTRMFRNLLPMISVSIWTSQVYFLKCSATMPLSDNIWVGACLQRAGPCHMPVAAHLTEDIGSSQNRRRGPQWLLSQWRWQWSPSSAGWNGHWQNDKDGQHHKSSVHAVRVVYSVRCLKNVHPVNFALYKWLSVSQCS